MCPVVQHPGQTVETTVLLKSSSYTDNGNPRMHGLLIRSFCTVLAVGLLFSGLYFARAGYREHALALAGMERARAELASRDQERAVVEAAWERLNRAQTILAGLEPVPRDWTSYPLVMAAVLESKQAGHVLGLLGRRDGWTMMRTEALTIRSECGLEPCDRFHMDLRAVAYDPVPINTRNFGGN
jgi:hypothetical protein